MDEMNVAHVWHFFYMSTKYTTFNMNMQLIILVIWKPVQLLGLIFLLDLETPPNCK